MSLTKFIFIFIIICFLTKLALYHDPSAPPRTASVPTMAALGRCIGAYARVAPQKYFFENIIFLKKNLFIYC